MMTQLFRLSWKRCKNGSLASLTALIVLLILMWPTVTAWAAPPAQGGSIASLLTPSLHLAGYAVFPERLDWAAELGLNTVAEVPASTQFYADYISRATARGMKVRVSISPSFLTQSDAVVTNYIKTLAAYDGVAMWYLPEEPLTAADHQAWGRLYNLIKSADPKKRPIGLYIAEDVTPEYFAYWSQVADVIFCGAYPELYGIERVSIVTRIKGAVAATAGTSKWVISTPQFMDGATYARVERVPMPSGWYPGHPTYQHMRFDAYISLMLGAAGLDWYSTEWGYYDADMVESLRQVLSEINQLSAIFTSPEPALEGMSYRILSGPTMSAWGKGQRHPSIYITARHYRGNDYIFVASLVADRVVAEFYPPPGIDLTGYSAEVLFEGRSVSLPNGILTDEFNDFAVHVYRIARVAEGGKQLVSAWPPKQQ